MARILILEDDDSIREAVAQYLRSHGHEVVECPRAECVAEAKGSVDLFLLDIRVPGGNGFTVAQTLRRRTTAPIIFLTSRDDERSRIAGLELGADDYVTKPFSPRELVLRVEAVLRRTKGHNQGGAVVTDAPGVRSFSLPAEGNTAPSVLTIDEDRVRVEVKGEKIAFTATEWRLLEHLLRLAPAVVSREELAVDVLGYGAMVHTRTVDAHVKNLRHKLLDARWIETVRGFGYRFTGRDS